MTEKEPVFSDFALLELSHLDRRDILYERLYGKGKLKDLLDQRLAFARQEIEENTMPGDLILIESPASVTFEQFVQSIGTPTIFLSFFPAKIRKELEKKGEGYLQKLKNDPAIKERWETTEQFNLNFYRNVALMAKKMGRTVESVDYGLATFGSRLHRYFTRIPRIFPKTRVRLNYLATHQRDLGMQKKVQQKKPAMVIVAGAHAAFLARAMKPKKMVWNNPWVTEQMKDQYFVQWEKEARAYQKIQARRNKKRRAFFQKRLQQKKRGK